MRSFKRLFSQAARTTRRVVVVWGSQTGTATLFARALVQDVKSMGFPSVVGVGAEELNNTVLDPKQDIAFFIQATFGQGEPTDNAKHLFDSLHSGEDMRELRFAVFGLGMSLAYPDRYQAAGKALDQLLEENGGVRWMPRGEGDDSGDAEEDFNHWKDQVLEKLKPILPSASAAAPSQPAPSSSTTSVTTTTMAPAVSTSNWPQPVAPQVHTQIGVVGTLLSSAGASFRQSYVPGRPIDYENAFPARLIALRRLDLWSVKKTVHLELDVSSAEGLTYETGDYAGIHPANHPAVVANFCEVLQLKPETTFVLSNYMGEKKAPFPSPCSVEDYLTYYADIQGPLKRQALQRVATYCDDQDKAFLKELLVPTEFKNWVQAHKSMLDVLKQLKTPISLPAMVDIFPALSPRYYSIASSALVSPKTVQMCVGVHEFTRADGMVEKGVCSNFLVRQKLGCRVPIFMKKSLFRLPTNPRTPVIMCAVGSGIAPFRAFVQERSAATYYLPRERTKDMLFYGSMREKQDFLYAEEFIGNPVLDVYPAFSHDDPNKVVFVQDRMREMGELIWYNVDKKGAHVYLCGHSKMARGVRDVLTEIAVKYGSMSKEEGARYWARLHEEYKLHEDVFDSGLGAVEL